MKSLEEVIKETTPCALPESSHQVELREELAAQLKTYAVAEDWSLREYSLALAASILLVVGLILFGAPENQRVYVPMEAITELQLVGPTPENLAPVYHNMSRSRNAVKSNGQRLSWEEVLAEKS